MTWGLFRPYITAYLWPVQNSPDSEIELYACSEVNGAGRLEGPETLRQAGFLVAMGFAEDEAMFVALRTLVQNHNRGAERSVPAVTRAIEEFLERPEVRRHVCRTLDEVRWFTSVAVEECSGSGDYPRRTAGMVKSDEGFTEPPLSRSAPSESPLGSGAASR
jgi:hypothetical protein